MSDLRTLFPDSRYNITVGGSATFGTVRVYNTTMNSPQNGGCCCYWTVPAGVTWAKFEVWGSGGDGGGACCCQHPAMGGGSGSYTRKTTRVVPGQGYTICAGGSGCCSQTCKGTDGFPSYVCNASATYPVCLCASGGYGGTSGCFYAIGSCFHCSTNICGTTCGGDFSICGITGSAHASWCGYDSWHYSPNGPYLGTGVNISRTHCGEFWMGCAGNPSVFPGGGGGTAISYGGSCCWGGWGAGGLVIVTYK